MVAVLAGALDDESLEDRVLSLVAGVDELTSDLEMVGKVLRCPVHGPRKARETRSLCPICAIAEWQRWERERVVRFKPSHHKGERG